MRPIKYKTEKERQAASLKQKAAWHAKMMQYPEYREMYRERSRRQYDKHRVFIKRDDVREFVASEVKALLGSLEGIGDCSRLERELESCKEIVNDMAAELREIKKQLKWGKK